MITYLYNNKNNKTFIKVCSELGGKAINSYKEELINDYKEIPKEYWVEEIASMNDNDYEKMLNRVIYDFGIESLYNIANKSIELSKNNSLMQEHNESILTIKILSIEHRNKISESKKGKSLTNEHKEAISKGVKNILTYEHRNKISNSMKGKPKSDEHKQKLKDAWLRRKTQV